LDETETIHSLEVSHLTEEKELVPCETFLTEHRRGLLREKQRKERKKVSEQISD